MAPTKQPGRAELLPRYLYFASLLKGRRVLEVGSIAATDGLSAHFLAKLSLEVTAVDDVPEAVAKAQKTLGRPELDFRMGPASKIKGKLFDVIFASEVTDAAQIEELSKLVARKGVLIVAFRNPAGPALASKATGGSSKLPAQVINMLSQKFEATAVLTQTALLGYEISPEQSEELTVDGSLVDEVTPAYQLVAAGATLPSFTASSLFRISPDDVDMGADQATFKALEAELHQLRVELVEKQAAFHAAAGAALGAEQTMPTDVHQQQMSRKKAGEKAPAPATDHGPLLESALTQLKKAGEELKAAAETAARLKQALDAETKARAAVEKELDAARAEQSALEKQVTEKLEALRLAATSERQARERKFDEELALVESRYKAQFEGERDALQKKISDGEAMAAKLNNAGRELSGRLKESEAALAKAKARVGELEEEVALGKSMESSALAAEQAQSADLRAKLEALEARFSEFGAREQQLLAALEQEKVNAASVDRQFASVMRELREALDQKEALEKQVANEKLERARLERMRKA